MTIKLSLGHLKLALFLIWIAGVLPLLTWWTIIQFLPGVTFLQMFLPYILLYGLVVTEELVRGFITKGQ